MIEYEIWLDDALGNRLALLDTLCSLAYTRSANAVGAFQIQLPYTTTKAIRQDNIVEIWRKPTSGATRLMMAGFIRKAECVDSQDGMETIAISGPDTIDLLNTRIVAYAASSAYSLKTDQADDMMKAVVRENLGSLAIAARNLTANGFTVQADFGAAPSLTRAFAWKNVLKVLQDLAAASREAGTQLYFDVVPVPTGAAGIGLEFRTSIGQLGMDHSYTSQIPVMFGKAWGNLQNAKLVFDYSDETTYVYAGGQGQDFDRQVVEVSDTARIGASAWNRREEFVNASSEKDSNGLTAKGQAVLSAGRPKVRFSGDLLDTDAAAYGKHWYYGDRVTATYKGLQFDGMIRAIKVAVDGNGAETVSAKMEGEL